MAKTAQIFCKAVDSYTMISMLIEQFCTAMNILQFSPCKLWRSRSTSIWPRLRRECNRSKAMSVYFRMVLLWCQLEPYKRTYANMAKTAQIFCKAVDSYTMISMLNEQFFMYCNEYPSILTV